MTTQDRLAGQSGCVGLAAFALCACVATPVAAQTRSLQDVAGALVVDTGTTTIYTAREFITMDPKRPRAEAIAVRDGKIVAVGTRTEVGAAAGSNARLDKSFNDKVAIAEIARRY